LRINFNHPSFGGACSQGILEFALLIKLDTDVEAANEVAIDVQLRESGPLRELFHALSHFLILEDVKVTKGWNDSAHIFVE